MTGGGLNGGVGGKEGDKVLQGQGVETVYIKHKRLIKEEGIWIVLLIVIGMWAEPHEKQGRLFYIQTCAFLIISRAVSKTSRKENSKMLVHLDDP